MSLEENLEIIVGFTFMSTLTIFFSLFYYAAIQDYAMVPLYDIADNLVTSGITSDIILGLIESIDEVYMLLPTVLDYIWLLSAIGLAVELIISSYYIKRNGYLSLLSLMFWGNMILLFILEIYIVLSNWILDEILYPVLPNLEYATPFFNYYLSHAGIINAILIMICIIVNAVDFDISSYFQRKERERILMGGQSGNEVA